MLSLLIRGIRRAALPIAYSEGYNPRPRLWLMLPKSVGIACLDDLLVVELGQDCPATEFVERLGKHLPDGIKLHKAFKVAPGYSLQPTAAVYGLDLSQQDIAELSTRIPEVLAQEELLVERFSRKAGVTQQLNIRPYLIQMSLDALQLTFTLSVTPTGSAKPSEVLSCLGLDTPSNRAKLLRKKTIYGDAQVSESAATAK